jgi:hypothetical protein
MGNKHNRKIYYIQIIQSTCSLSSICSLIPAHYSSVQFLVNMHLIMIASEISSHTSQNEDFGTLRGYLTLFFLLLISDTDTVSSENFFGGEGRPMTTHAPYGLRGHPWLWPKCYRLLRLGRPWGAVTLSRWGGWWYMNMMCQEGPYTTVLLNYPDHGFWEYTFSVSLQVQVCRKR